MMKRAAAIVIAALGTLSVNAWAQNDMYMGLDLFHSSNNFHVDVSGSSNYSYNVDDDSGGFKLKLGALLDDGLRLQGYLLGEKFNDPVFDATNDELTEIGLDIIKEFGMNGAISPFIQGGIGYGVMAFDEGYYYSSSNSNVDELNLKVGLGLLFKLSPAFELLTGLDFQWRNWSDIKYYDGFNYYKYQTADGSARFYIGANFIF